MHLDKEPVWVFFNLIAALQGGWLPWGLKSHIVGQGPLLGGSPGVSPRWGHGQMMACPSPGAHRALTAHVAACS